MYCPNCGKKLSEGSRFCGNCGANIETLFFEKDADAHEELSSGDSVQNDHVSAFISNRDGKEHESDGAGDGDFNHCRAGKPLWRIALIVVAVIVLATVFIISFLPGDLEDDTAGLSDYGESVDGGDNEDEAADVYVESGEEGGQAYIDAISNYETVNDTLADVLQGEKYLQAELEQKAELLLEELSVLEASETVVPDSIVYDEDDQSISFCYQDGAMAVIALASMEDGAVGNGTDSYVQEYTEEGLVKEYSLIPEFESEEYPFEETDLSALVLYGLGEEGAYGDIKNKLNSYMDAWNESFLLTQMNDSCTVEELRTALTGYDYIFIFLHGYQHDGQTYIALDETVRYEVKAADSLGQKTISTVDVSYINDLQSNRIIYYWSDLVEWTYALSPEFFIYYYGDAGLSGSILWLGSCSGYKDDIVVSALAGCGADSVLGCTETVDGYYDVMMQHAFVYSLLCGNTVENSLDFAKSIWGENDSIFKANYTDNLEDDTPSEFRIYNGKDVTLVSLTETAIESLGTNETSDFTYELYQTLLENRVSSGEWNQNLEYGMNIEATYEGETHAIDFYYYNVIAVSGYEDEDLSDLDLTGKGYWSLYYDYDDSVLNYEWTLNYSEGLLNYSYTKPSVATGQGSFEEAFFYLPEIEETMMTGVESSDGLLQFTIPAEYISVLGLDAYAEGVIMMGDTAESIEYTDVTVLVYFEAETVTDIYMSFGANNIFSETSELGAAQTIAEYELHYGFFNYDAEYTAVAETGDSDLELYAKVLNMFYYGISTQWEDWKEAYDDSADYPLSYRWYFYDETETLSDAGFALIDLDGNGISELLINTVDNVGSGIMDLYTYKDGTVLHLASDGERMNYWLCTDFSVACWGSTGAYNDTYTFFTMSSDSDGLQSVVSIFHQYADSYHDVSESYIKDGGESISAEEAEKIINSYVALDYELTLFSDYTPSAEYDISESGETAVNCLQASQAWTSGN